MRSRSTGASATRARLAEGGARHFTLVADRDGAIVAFCTVEMPSHEGDEPDHVAGIPALYADPEAFRTGAGRALMETAVEATRDAGYRELILWMLEGNERAAAFYERGGWVCDGGRRHASYPGISYASDDERPIEVRYRLVLSPRPARRVRTRGRA